MLGVNVGRRVVRYRSLLLAVGLCCLMVNCAHWRDNYLDSGVGVLTQAEVKEKFGKPHIVNDPLLSDETTWMYRHVLTEGELDPLVLGADDGPGRYAAGWHCGRGRSGPGNQSPFDG